MAVGSLWVHDAFLNFRNVLLSIQQGADYTLGEPTPLTVLRRE